MIMKRLISKKSLTSALVSESFFTTKLESMSDKNKLKLFLSLIEFRIFISIKLLCLSFRKIVIVGIKK